MDSAWRYCLACWPSRICSPTWGRRDRRRSIGGSARPGAVHRIAVRQADRHRGDHLRPSGVAVRRRSGCASLATGRHRSCRVRAEWHRAPSGAAACRSSASHVAGHRHAKRRRWLLARRTHAVDARCRRLHPGQTEPRQRLLGAWIVNRTTRLAAGCAAVASAGARAGPAILAERLAARRRCNARPAAIGSSGCHPAAGPRIDPGQRVAASVIDPLPVVVIALPFASAAVLALVGSWRIGIWINAGSATLLLLLAALLPWHLHAPVPLLHIGAPETQLVLLTSLVAMTTSWFSRRDVPASLATRSLDRRRARLYHAACQALVGAILLA